MTLDTAIFDLDGTLIDSKQDIIVSMRAACASIGHPDTEIDKSLIGLRVKEIARRLFAQEEERTFEEFERAFRADYDNREHTLSNLFPGVAATLDALGEKGVHLFLATMKPARPTADILRRFGIERHFQRWRSLNSWPGAWLGKREVLQRLIEEEGIDRRRAAYVGDHPDDVTAARGVGVLGIAALYGYGDRERVLGAQPDIAIGDIGELAAIF